MDKKVQIQKTVLDRTGFKDFIDNSFKFFKEPDPVVDTDTVEELFRLYDKLYLEVPIEGDSPSHQYLVEQSSELYQVDKQLENIQPLLDEVASLRTQLLEANRNILELETKLASGGEISFDDAEALATVRIELEAAQATIASLEQANTIANNATKEAQDQAKAAADAAKKAQEEATAQATQTSTTTTGSTLSVRAQELVKLFDKRRHKYYYVRRMIEKKVFTNHFFRRQKGVYVTRYPWLYRQGVYNNTMGVIPNNRREAREVTLDFFIEDALKRYSAEDIVAAVADQGNFKNRVRMDLQYDNDGELDDRYPILWSLID